MSANTFFILGVILGVLIFIEAMLIRKNEGRVSLGVMSITLVEGLWLIVCIYALYYIDFSSWTIAIPVLYLVYAYGAMWNYKGFGKDAKDLDDFKALKLPLGFTKVQLVAGVVMVAMNLLAFVQLG